MMKKLLSRILAIGVVAIAGWYLLSCQTEVITPVHHEAEESEIPLPHSWQLMTESVFLWENGKEKFLAGENSDLSNFLIQTLHKLNLQMRCAFGEEHIQEIKQNNRVIELRFRHPRNITISQWIEPEERYYIPTDEKGYRILENVKNALFILEDNLDEGLEGHILVGHEVGCSCWAIQQEGSKEIDKTWIDEIDKILLKPTEEKLNVKEEEIVREAVELVWNSGRIPYKCPLKVLKSNLIIENEKVKEVHLTLDCGGKIFKVRIDWQNKKVILIEDA